MASKAKTKSIPTLSDAQAAPAIVQTTLPLTMSLIGGVGLISGGIKRLSFGPLSHVDAEDPVTGWLFGARSDKVKRPEVVPSGIVVPDGKKIPAGCQWRPPGYYGRVKKHVTMTLQVPRAVHDAYWAFLKDQRGKPYNAWGIVGMLLNEDWRAPDSWFCSELQGRAGEVSNLYPTLFTPTDRVTPVEIALLWSGLGAKVVELPC